MGAARPIGEVETREPASGLAVWGERVLGIIPTGYGATSPGGRGNPTAEGARIWPVREHRALLSEGGTSI